MKIVEANKVALHVSGTASIDEAGEDGASGGLRAPRWTACSSTSRPCSRARGRAFDDVVSAVTYLKRPGGCATRLREKLRDAGFGGFPNVLVAAPVCRPELLCEAEALAVLPRAAATPTLR